MSCGGGAYIPAPIPVEGSRRSTRAQKGCARQSPHVLSGVREWRADDNRYRKLEHTMIHDVQIQN